jgi:hypothetical protein
MTRNPTQTSQVVMPSNTKESQQRAFGTQDFPLPKDLVELFHNVKLKLLNRTGYEPVLRFPQTSSN